MTNLIKQPLFHMFVGFHHFSDLSGWLLIRRLCGPQSIRPNHKGGYWSTLIRWCNTTDRMNFVFLIKEYTWCFHGTHRSDIIRMRSIVVLPLTFYNSIAIYDMTEAISILDLHFFFLNIIFLKWYNCFCVFWFCRVYSHLLHQPCFSFDL